MPEKSVSNNLKSKNMLLCVLVLLVLMPGLLFLTWRFAARRYYLCGVLMIACATIPFIFSLEKRRPQARELVTLAVMCAIAVAARTAFIMIPHFKPMTGIIIITAISFGPETGFLAGLISCFVSNFIFGQGPWTPWQMFAYGVAGFLAGTLSKAGFLDGTKNKRAAVFGFLTVVLIVGPILDTSTLVTMSTGIDRAAAGAIYLSGLPVNIIHGLATFLTVLILCRPITEKLDRIKIKYGIMNGER